MSSGSRRSTGSTRCSSDRRTCPPRSASPASWTPPSSRPPRPGSLPPPTPPASRPASCPATATTPTPAWRPATPSSGSRPTPPCSPRSPGPSPPRRIHTSDRSPAPTGRRSPNNEPRSRRGLLIPGGNIVSTIAFIGLGIMGLPMAAHLVDAGHKVVGYNRSPDRTRQLVERGGVAAESAADAAREADIVAVMVPDSPQVQDVLVGGGAVFDAVRPGTLIIDFSSIRPDVTVELAAEAAKRGLRLIDAPVSGGEAGAVAATLSIMVGGESADFDAAQPVLQTVGRTVIHVGPHGAGQTVKAANQLIVAGTIQLLAEALVLVEAYGVDADAALTVLGGGLAGSAVLNQQREHMLSRSFQPGFRIDLHHKDLGIVTAAAREAGVVVPLGALVAQLMASARANGDGGLDHSALLRGVLRLSGKDPDGSHQAV